MKTGGRAPAECSGLEVARFCELVRAGGEVDEAGLRERVMRAERLVFSRDGDCIVGVAGLKNPYDEYRAGVFAKAGVSNPSDFPLELGWVFVVPERRGQGLSNGLVESGVAGVETGVFATSWVDNAAMHSGLRRYGFEQAGQPYESERSERKLLLFVRPGRPTRG